MIPSVYLKRLERVNYFWLNGLGGFGTVRLARLEQKGKLAELQRHDSADWDSLPVVSDKLCAVKIISK